MQFENRFHAGKELAKKLSSYKATDTVVYALPRGGVIVGCEVAKFLKLPLDMVITRKIGHPDNPEYAIAAVSQSLDIVCDKEEIRGIDVSWFDHEVKMQRQEAKRRREVYLSGRDPISCAGKAAIIVDDGTATGLTIRAAIKEIKYMNPSKIIIALPVIPDNVVSILKKDADEVVGIVIPKHFLGAVGAYYKDFSQVSDEKVVKIIKMQRFVR